MKLDSLDPHIVCWSFDWKLVLLHGIFDFITYLSYMSIPFTAFKIYKSGHLKGLKTLYPGLWQLGALFILFCGLSHLGSFIEIWKGGIVYWITGINKVLLGFTSALFAIVFWRLKDEIIYFATILREVREEEENARD